MDYFIGTNIKFAQQATENIKLYKKNKIKLVNSLKYPIIEQLKNLIINESLNKGSNSLNIGLTRSFDYKTIVGKDYIPDKEDKEIIKQFIIDFLVKEDFKYDCGFESITIKWENPQ